MSCQTASGEMVSTGFRLQTERGFITEVVRVTFSAALKCGVARGYRAKIMGNVPPSYEVCFLCSLAGSLSFVTNRRSDELPQIDLGDPTHRSLLRHRGRPWSTTWSWLLQS